MARGRQRREGQDPGVCIQHGRVDGRIGPLSDQGIVFITVVPGLYHIEYPLTRQEWVI